jgi:hypothetical protein
MSEETYQMLHNSARDCGWSFMMPVAILGLRRRRGGGLMTAMLR